MDKNEKEYYAAHMSPVERAVSGIVDIDGAFIHASVVDDNALVSVCDEKTGNEVGFNINAGEPEMQVDIGGTYSEMDATEMFAFFDWVKEAHAKVQAVRDAIDSALSANA
jgi:hypothetical protein